MLSVLDPSPIDACTLIEGGQSADDVAARLVAFLGKAEKTLEIALYDVRLPGAPGDAVAGALRDAACRSVAIRLLYNVDSGRPSAIHPPPDTRPDLLNALPIECKPVPGEPDLMHHKFVVRDSSAVWSGSTNWTTDSWTLQENIIVTVDSAGIAADFLVDFEELWATADVEKSGFGNPDPVDVDGRRVRAWFTPGHGEDLSQAIATAIGSAKKVRIASPVITSGPVLGTLAELGADPRRTTDVRGVVDWPQTRAVFGQWRDNGRSAWKIPLLATTLDRLPFSGKLSTPWGPSTIHDFMHAKVTVADDVVFAGSFNLSRSGEQNAENVLEIHDAALARTLSGWIDGICERYPAVEVPEEARRTISAGSSESSASSRSPGDTRPSDSSAPSIQSSSPDQ